VIGIGVIRFSDDRHDLGACYVHDNLRHHVAERDRVRGSRELVASALSFI
jgi:hypothetical protein